MATCKRRVAVRRRRDVANVAPLRRRRTSKDGTCVEMEHARRSQGTKRAFRRRQRANADVEAVAHACKLRFRSFRCRRALSLQARRDVSHVLVSRDVDLPRSLHASTSRRIRSRAARSASKRRARASPRCATSLSTTTREFLLRVHVSTWGVFRLGERVSIEIFAKDLG